MSPHEKYEVVIGLEVHAQLLTRSKLFSGDSAAYGAEPNLNTSPITLAHPGTLPRMNRVAIRHAIKLGLACSCEIVKDNFFARKHYFYPDLPKGFQVSQHTTPICKGGIVKVRTTEGEKNIRLNRIHMEEDAGKSIHDLDPDYTSVDYNRAGVPLVEIVSEPDLRSSDEAYSFLTELRKLVRYLGICDGNMEEGSMRCDANISVRLKGEEQLGTKVEVKNLNSIRNVKKAIEFESERLISLLQNNQKIVQETRSFDANNGSTFAIREKEEADDYRYFAEPDLTPFRLGEDFIEEIRNEIPMLQEERIAKYTGSLQLSDYDAGVLTEERSFSDYFEQIIGHTKSTKAAANWMLGPVKSWLNENNKEIEAFPLKPVSIAGIIELIDNGKISFSIASTRLWNLLLKNPEADPSEVAVEANLLIESNENEIELIIDEVLQKHSSKVAEYQKGKKGLIALFVGEVMKKSKGKADPKLTNELLTKKLKTGN